MFIFYFLAKIAGAILIISAVLLFLGPHQTLIGDYNPFRLGGPFLQIGISKTLAGFVTYFLSCVLGAAGWFLLTWKPEVRPNQNN